MAQAIKLVLHSNEEFYCILLKTTKNGIYYKDNFVDHGFIPIDEIKYIAVIGDVIG